ncbi:MAG: endonuclease/exonuclease/phosphatase family protein [Phycisphaerales bacterium]
MTNRVLCYALAGAASLCCCAGASAQIFAADADFGEWAGVSPLATDPEGDASGAFDITAVYAASEGTDLFLRFDTGSVRNLISGSGSDGDFRVLVTRDGQQLRLDYRNRSVTFNGSSRSWVDVGAELQPTYAASEFELKIDLASIGASVGDTVEINFSGSDALASSATFTLSAPETAPERRDPSRAAGAFRIASVNTEQSGLISGSRRPRLQRLIDAMDADIYCFQEEYDSSASDVQNAVEGADPLEDGATWNVHKNNDNLIVSHYPVIGAPSNSSSYAAALVDLPGDGAVFVLSIHPKCCGYINSSEDATRIGQANDMADTIADFRAGALGATLAAYADAPVIIVGDWNLVGSRTPLDIIEDPAGPALTTLPMPNLIGESVLTWRNPSSSFAPGRLDLLTYDAAQITPTHAFVFDTTALNGTERSTLGVQATDSDASDHLMLVADFAFPPSGDPDLNGDGVVDGADLGLLLGAWGSAGPTDLNGDGVTDGADLGLLLGAWG